MFHKQREVLITRHDFQNMKNNVGVKVKGKVKSLCLIKYHAMKTYGGVEV
jgi:hypothetical protein